MYSSASHTRIFIALAAGVFIVVGAWMLSNTKTSKLEKIAAEIPVTVAPKREAIPVTDSNQDGVPDWQEAFNESSPLALIKASSSYETPDTLTDQFALDFFEQMVRNKTYGDFGASTDEFINRSGDYLAEQASDALMTQEDINISASVSPQDLSQYGEAIARIINTYSEEQTENEAVLLNRVLSEGNADDFKTLEQKITIYENYITDTKKLTVPAVVAQDHLALLNSYLAIKNDITAMRYAQEDPMLALLRLKRYQDDADGLYFSIVNLYTTLINNGAGWNPSSTVFQLIALDNN